MRIGEGNQRPKYDPSVKKVSSREKVGKLERKAKIEQPSDEVRISEQTRLVQKARRSIDALPIVRVEKVRPIDQAIKDGDYEIKDEEVAEKIVDETLKDELL